METHADIRKREQDVCRGAGRPSRNPFRYPEVEQDFYRRAREVVARCYDPSPENEKKPFRVSERCRLGKTHFWAFIFYMYVRKERFIERELCPLFPDLDLPLVEDNLQHFLMLLRGHVGGDCVGDRSAVSKNMIKCKELPISYTDRFFGELGTADAAKANSSRKWRSIYQEVLRLWFAS